MIIINELNKTEKFYSVFHLIGLWDPIQKKGELYINKNHKINEKFKDFIKCLRRLIEFEEFYISFGQLIPEWRGHNISQVSNGYNYKEARSNVRDYIQKIQEHPYFLLDSKETVMGVELQTKNMGVKMLSDIL